MILGSHNSMSYKSIRQWWLKPFFWAARCQSASLFDQFVFYGVRVFDFRVRFNKSGDITFAHGPIEYTGTVPNYLTILDHMASKFKDQPTYCRIILECNARMKDQDLQDEHFCYFCEDMEQKFKNIIFFGGNRKYDWKKLYNFASQGPSLDDKYSSTTILSGENNYTKLAKLDDLWPWLYAKLNNKKNKRKGTDKDCLFIDFVNI